MINNLYINLLKFKQNNIHKKKEIEHDKDEVNTG